MEDWKKYYEAALHELSRPRKITEGGWGKEAKEQCRLHVARYVECLEKTIQCLEEMATEKTK